MPDSSRYDNHRSLLPLIEMEERRSLRIDLIIYSFLYPVAMMGVLIGAGAVTLPGSRFWTAPGTVAVLAVFGAAVIAVTVFLIHRRRRHRLALAVEMAQMSSEIQGEAADRGREFGR